jgi:Predicted membrane protein
MKTLLFRRYAGFCVASALMALGIAMITNSNLGTTPITSLPFTLGAIFSLSLGTVTFLLNAVFLLAQKLLLWKEFSAHHLIQLPAVLLFSVFIDLSMKVSWL